MFEILSKDERSAARTGRLTTEHGIVETPSYVVVGTNAAVRCLEPGDLPGTKTQMVIANTYHLWRELGEEGLRDYPGLHQEMGWSGPIMTDSGGFQVFSLGAAREHGAGKVQGMESRASRAEDAMVRVTDAGVYFVEGGEEHYLDAELSMKIQEQLGADIIFAFDEPSSPHHDRDYTRLAMERTHIWAERSLAAKASTQRIYGITQGGGFEDLRRESAEAIGAMPFDGFAIGGSFGTSFGSTETQLLKELAWSVPFLPEYKPRHLLGIGRVADLFNGVLAGIDTFDCVIPTREARHGSLWTRDGRLDIGGKGKYAEDGGVIETDCGCFTCAERGIPRRELHAMFREKNFEAGRLATIHNIYFFNDLMEKIRGAISSGTLADFKKEYLKEGP
ncbi:MAG: tRNA guanosine(34) transglycosylase Tgt [Patescibacteria group bacterium]